MKKLIAFVCDEEDELELCKGIPDGHLVTAMLMDEKAIHDLKLMESYGAGAGLALARAFIKEKAGKSRRK